MSVVSWRRADVVECLGLKPCWSFAGEINSLIEGKMSAPNEACLLLRLPDSHRVMAGGRDDPQSWIKPTNVKELYLLSVIAPSDMRRNVCARVERT